MPRKPRIEYPGACYHILARGNRGQQIYFDRQDSVKFLDLLTEIADEKKWRIFNWCLMPNHYHLLIETEAANLSSGMKKLNQRFAQYSNRKTGQTGHLLAGRYKALPVEKESVFHELVRYIALNHVKSGMAQHPEDWIWGGYRQLIGKDTKDGIDLPIDRNQILGRLDQNPAQAVLKLQRFVMEGLSGAEAAIKKLSRAIEEGRILGSEAFTAALGERTQISALRSLQAVSAEEFAEQFDAAGGAMPQQVSANDNESLEEGNPE